MAALATVAPRLAKLIPRLATNHDGEIVATVRAIERTLKSAGLDFHALAQAVETPAPRMIESTNTPTTWGEVARWCRDHDHTRLTEKERAFVADMAARFICDSEPTEKQAAWLRAIYARLWKANAA